MKAHDNEEAMYGQMKKIRGKRKGSLVFSFVLSSMKSFFPNGVQNGSGSTGRAVRGAEAEKWLH